MLLLERREYRQFESLCSANKSMTRENTISCISSTFPPVSGRSAGVRHRESEFRSILRSVQVVSQDATLPVAFSANDGADILAIRY
jgi:hypothetical protein